MNNVTWIVVADSSRARIFERPARGAALVEMEGWVRPESRSRSRDLVSDRPGRTFDSRGRARHAKQPEHNPHQVQQDDFALDLARRLDRARKSGRFSRLVVVAGPRFAGLLHRHLPAATAALIRREVHKNLVRRSEATIRAAVASR
jgi:protein required for attachment to host cells